MRFNVLAIPPFDRQLKRLIKKYPIFKKDIGELAESLAINPKQGVAIGKGKSGGARVITYLYMEQQTVYLLAVYDKSEVSTILDAQIVERLKHIPLP